MISKAVAAGHICLDVIPDLSGMELEKPDALSGVPDWDGVQERIETVPRDPLTVEGTGWSPFPARPFLWISPSDQSKK